MTRSWKPLLLAGLVTTAVACGVPEQKYKAALAETDKAVKEGASQRQRADACEQKLGDATKHGAELSQELAKTRESSQAEKTRLEAEKTAAALDADQQRKLASKLAEEKTALAKKSAEYESLASSLDSEIKAGRIQLSELQGKVTLRMAEKVLFPSGSATVSRDGKATLGKIADAFKDVKGRMIRVEGHTDNVPIKTVRFPSNWELSSARAIAVVRILQDDGVDPTLLGAAGYSEYQPIAPNETPAGRAQNRRIEVSLAAPFSALPTSPGSGGR